MTWSKIVGVLKRLDSHLSDAVYLHGCYLTGQEKIVRHHPQDEGRAHLQESSNASGIQNWFRIAKASLISSTRPALTSVPAPFSMTRRFPLPAAPFFNPANLSHRR